MGFLSVETAVILGSVFVLAYIYLKTKASRGILPPGPPPLPVFGSLPFLGTDPREPLLKMTEKYGDIFTVYFGRRPVVILNSYEAIKEALVKNGNAFADRPQDLLIVEVISEGLGLVAPNGKFWQEQRRFAHGVLRDFGMGKSFLEDNIREELHCYLAVLQEQVNKPYCITHITQMAICNIICSILFGRRYDYNDKLFKKYLDAMNETVKIIGGAGALTILPFLRKLPGDYFGFKRLLETTAFINNFLRDHINYHHDTYDPGCTRDFIDAYIAEMKKEKENGLEMSTFHDKQLEKVLGDLFGGGTESTMTTISWGIIFLLHNPNVQERVKGEILDVLGSNRLPSMKDKVNLPYTEATIHEMQRLSDVLPLGAPRATVVDVKLRGYTIPKGTMVFPHLYAAHKDPRYWKDPYKFDPERFLGSNGKSQNLEFLIPFSMGRRMCLGESMARMELFLFFTTLLQKFTFKPVPCQPLPSLQGTLGATYSPKDFDVIMVPNE